MSQVDKKEAEFPFDSLQVPAVIVVMGLPRTFKKEVAGAIGRWARCPILIIDDFLDSIEEVAGYGEGSLPSREEAERLPRLAFDAVCRVARRHLDSEFSGCKCVVIKSPRICSTYELQRLLLLTRSRLILVECQFRNEYLWKFYCSNVEVRGRWYEPTEWKEIEKAEEDYNPQAFEDELQRLLNNLKEDVPRVRRLVLDSDDDIDIPSLWWTMQWRGEITHSLAGGIKFLLTAGEEELNKEIPLTVEFPKLRRYLMEKKIAAASASTQRRKYLCVGGGCVFKYTLESDSGCCGVCEDPLVLGEPAYSCYFCFLDMHKCSQTDASVLRRMSVLCVPNTSQKPFNSNRDSKPRLPPPYDFPPVSIY